jgi:Tfp pilus assembly major pilin PilA
MILVYIVSLIIVIKLYSSWKKKNKAIDSASKPIQTKADNEIVSKNRFLYPSDGLGKMEQGMVYESKTYQSKKRDYNTTTENYEIIQKK